MSISERYACVITSQLTNGLSVGHSPTSPACSWKHSTETSMSRCLQLVRVWKRMDPDTRASCATYLQLVRVWMRIDPDSERTGRRTLTETRTASVQNSKARPNWRRYQFLAWPRQQPGAVASLGSHENDVRILFLGSSFLFLYVWWIVFCKRVYL